MPPAAFDLTQPVAELAPALLGAVLRVGDVAVRLTETEAYAGPQDPASHAFRGPTPRTQVMFGPPGVLYVYRSYGIHSCVNIVCGEDGTASAVLLRGGQVIDGIDVAMARRGLLPGQEHRLARGPGCLGQALGLTPADSGLPIDGSSVSLEPGAAPATIATGPRVGVSQAADVAWRFWIAGDPTVSAYSRSPRAPKIAR